MTKKIFKHLFQAKQRKPELNKKESLDSSESGERVMNQIPDNQESEPNVEGKEHNNNRLGSKISFDEQIDNYEYDIEKGFAFLLEVAGSDNTENKTKLTNLLISSNYNESLLRNLGYWMFYDLLKILYQNNGININSKLSVLFDLFMLSKPDSNLLLCKSFDKESLKKLNTYLAYLSRMELSYSFVPKLIFRLASVDNSSLCKRLVFSFITQYHSTGTVDDDYISCISNSMTDCFSSYIKTFHKIMQSSDMDRSDIIEQTKMFFFPEILFHFAQSTNYYFWGMNNSIFNTITDYLESKNYEWRKESYSRNKEILVDILTIDCQKNERIKKKKLSDRSSYLKEILKNITDGTFDNDKIDIALYNFWFFNDSEKSLIWEFLSKQSSFWNNLDKNSTDGECYMFLNPLNSIDSFFNCYKGMGIDLGSGIHPASFITICTEILSSFPDNIKDEDLEILKNINSKLVFTHEPEYLGEGDAHKVTYDFREIIIMANKEAQKRKASLQHTI